MTNQDKSSSTKAQAHKSNVMTSKFPKYRRGTSSKFRKDAKGNDIKTTKKKSISE